MLDTTRDARGPGQGANNFYGRELQYLVKNLNVVDGWLAVRGAKVAASRACGIHQSQLDKVYVPDHFSPNLQACEVVQLAPSRQKLSYFALLLSTMSTKTKIRKPLRMNPTIFHDEESIPVLRMKLAASLTEPGCRTLATWVHLKSCWHLIARQVGKECFAHITVNMNEVLRRIQIIEKGGSATFAMLEYVQTKESNIKFLKQMSQAPRLAKDIHLPTDAIWSLAYAQKP